MLSVELKQVKLRMASQYETHTHEFEGLWETEERLKGEVAEYQGKAEAATAVGARLRAEVDETVRQAVASALARRGCRLVVRACRPPLEWTPRLSFADQPQAANWFSGRWFHAQGGKDPDLMAREEHLKAAHALGKKAEKETLAEYNAAMDGEAEAPPLPYAALTGILATLEGRMELMLTYTDNVIHVREMFAPEFHRYLVSCVDLMALRKGLAWYQPSHSHRGGAL